jgi:prepilin-type N-terminal cleavage/methylation domain-containing protein
MLATVPHIGGRRRTGQSGISLIELLISMVILSIVSTMLIMTWISLQNAFAFTSADNKARATARDALTRISSEIRAAQPLSALSTTPFYVTGTAPYVCDGYDCTFYSAYNNPLAYSKSDLSGRGPATNNGTLLLTAIWLDTTGTTTQKPQATLYWQRDTNMSGALDSGDKKVILATDVVNTPTSMTGNPIFTYNLYDATNGYTRTNALDTTNVASVASVQVDIVVDANIAHAPRYIELMTTVEPRNQGSN